MVITQVFQPNLLGHSDERHGSICSNDFKSLEARHGEASVAKLRKNIGVGPDENRTRNRPQIPVTKSLFAT